MENGRCSSAGCGQRTRNKQERRNRGRGKGLFEPSVTDQGERERYFQALIHQGHKHKAHSTREIERKEKRKRRENREEREGGSELELRVRRSQLEPVLAVFF